jgi:hypothetical protein
MPSGTWQLMGEKIVDQTTFVTDTSPVFVTPGGGAPGYWIPGTGHSVNTRTSSPFKILNGSRSSSTTPGFNSKLRPPILKPLSFQFSQSKNQAYSISSVDTFPTSASTGPGTNGYEKRTTITTQSFGYPLIPNTIDSFRSKVQDKATQNALEQIKASSINAAQAVAERKQTMGLIASTATRCAQAYGSLKKGNFAKAARDLGVTPKKRAGRRFNSDYAVDQGKAVGNAWLELQYGWKPLLSDVYGATEAIAKANNPSGNQNKIFKKVTGRSTRKVEPFIKTNYPIGSGDIGYSYSVATGICMVSCRVGITYTKTSPAVSNLASLGITNPALLAWELLPYSFVADWFFPIGDYLGGLDATLGMAFESGYITTYEKYYSHVFEDHSYKTSSGYKMYYGYSTQDNENITVTRSTLGSFPSVPLPRFKNPISNSHVASAMALLLQNFKR